MLSPCHVCEENGQRGLWQLEELIDWRRLQLQALHRLRLHLAATLDGAPDPVAASCATAVSLASPPDTPCLVVRIADGTEVTVDTGFLERTELLALKNLLAAPWDTEQAASLRLRVAERIDELNQLNRCSFEVLRLLAP